MKLPVFALLCALNVSACAQSTPATADKAPEPAAKGASPASTASAGGKQAGSKEAMVRAALKALNPKIEVDRIGPAPMPGFQEAIVAGQVLYFSDDGRYMLQGSLYDMHEKKDLSQIGLSELRREQLEKIPVTDRIVFAPVGTPKHTVAVFTDIECGYCRKLHSEMADYNKLGIAVQYLAFPRAGLTSPDALAMESVWCSDDRRQALTEAKNGRPVPPKRCNNPVTAQYELGQRIGLQGTPMIINSDGVAMPGYMPPAQLLEALDKLAAESKGKVAAAAGGR
ncbi:MAG: thioredoxin fold domain-containing protein [Lysobacter sp.]|nr:thioredoxin fold domain-containing protein [Lysobacter sp.]